MPGSQAFFTRAKRGVLGATELEDLCKQLAAKPAPGKKGPTLEEFREELTKIERAGSWLSGLPVSLDLRKDRAMVAVGFGDGEPFTLVTPETPKELQQMDKDLAAHARTLKAEFRKDVTTESLIAEFLKEVNKSK